MTDLFMFRKTRAVQRRPKKPATQAAKLAELRASVDELGKLKAKIAALTAREAELKAAIKAAVGASGSIDGALFRATVSTAEQEVLDMAAVRAKLSPQWVRAHSSRRTQVRVNVVARVRDLFEQEAS